jgi:hypothetical protein
LSIHEINLYRLANYFLNEKIKLPSNTSNKYLEVILFNFFYYLFQIFPIYKSIVWKLKSFSQIMDTIDKNHRPMHPLPDDILKMKRDETVCKFCGVSYLIHSEIKALEDKIAVS